MAQIRELYDRLVDLDPEDRAPLVQGAPLEPDQRRRLQAMLDASDGQRTLLDLPLEAAIERLRDDDVQLLQRMVGTRIGPFRLLELIGSGGSSAVFRADRPAGLGSQTVALKLLQQGLCSVDARRRFMREQAILARLSHPDIARLIEAGVSDTGIPYIAMELIEGEPIDRYMDAAKLGMTQRLRLFARLCRAVDAAHASLVVHCDLKPANVVVDADGNLKILDFGVAQLADQFDAGEHEHAMTPEYAAPEQIHGDPPSSATDVHALGVMLAELLTRQRLRAGDPPPSQALRQDAVSEPRPGLPGSDRLAARLHGDFDAIAARAVATDPKARYRSPLALAHDIERYLSRQPVSARPPSRLHAAGLFVRRHRATTLAISLLAVGLVVSTAIAWRQAIVSQEARDRADTMRNFILTAFVDAQPGRPGEPATVVDAVERALADLAENPDGSPATLELLVRLGEVLSAQGAHVRAAAVLEDARDTAAASLSPTHELVFEAETLLAKNDALDGGWASARKQLDRLVATIPEDMTGLRIDALTTSAWLAGVAREPGRGPAEAREALRLARRIGDVDRIMQAKRSLGTLLLAAGDGEGAIEVFLDLLAQRRARHGDVHTRVAAEEAALARAYRMTGNLEEAERHARTAVEIGRQVFPQNHWHKGLHLNALYMVLAERRAFDEALGVAHEIRRIDEATLPRDHPNVSGTYVSLSVMNGHLGNWDEAVAWSTRAMAIYRAKGTEAEYDGLQAGIVDAYARAVAYGRPAGERALAEVEARLRDDSDLRMVVQLRERQARVALDAGDVPSARAAAARMPSTDRLDPTSKVRAGLVLAEVQVAQRDWAAAASTLRDVRATAAGMGCVNPLWSAHAAMMLAYVAAQDPASALPGEAPRTDAANAWTALRYPPPYVVKLAAELGLPPQGDR